MTTISHFVVYNFLKYVFPKRVFGVGRARSGPPDKEF